MIPIKSLYLKLHREFLLNNRKTQWCNKRDRNENKQMHWLKCKSRNSWWWDYKVEYHFRKLLALSSKTKGTRWLGRWRCLQSTLSAWSHTAVRAPTPLLGLWLPQTPKHTHTHKTNQEKKLQLKTHNPWPSNDFTLWEVYLLKESIIHN